MSSRTTNRALISVYLATYLELADIPLNGNNLEIDSDLIYVTLARKQCSIPQNNNNCQNCHK